MAEGRVRLDIDGPIAVITNDNPEKRNAFNDDMDAQLFDILGELRDEARGAGGHLARRRTLVVVRP